ncbi:Asp-tRNA(Asn)/Glu-tRNA(Gln) amidotransferase GatCAB subunit B, partial [Mycobacteroides abscessus subsp. massiliense]
MNSFSHITKAMEYEMNRQIDLLESGEEVVQETRRYDEGTGCTEGMRGKEDANDYRYFRDPDLVAIHVTDEMVSALQAKMP